MISTHALADLGPRCAAKPEWVCLDVEEAYAKQHFVALARGFAEVFFRVFQNSGDVSFCLRGKP
jgi:hypothetical protein